MKIVVLAGGGGTRLWPYSRSSFPKQFLHFGSEHTLLQRTVLRCARLVPFSDIVVVTQKEYLHLVQGQLKAIDPLESSGVIIEPERRNTAPAIALAIGALLEQGCGEGEAVLVVPSDHLLLPESAFFALIPEALKKAEQGRLVLFGIRPSKPETGYGYIKADSEGNVQEFVEKPDAKTAYSYLLSGNYLWNSGMFLFQIGTFLEELKLHCPLFADKIGQRSVVEDFSELPATSIDYALMEKSRRALVMPLEVSWSDVGCWDSVYEILEKDEQCNATIGAVRALETKNCLIVGNKRLVATIGLEDLFIIETEDALLIGKKGESQKVKQLYEQVKEAHESIPEVPQNLASRLRESPRDSTIAKGGSIYDRNTTPLCDRQIAGALTEPGGQISSHFRYGEVHRPWGHFTVLEEGERYKIKRIVVEPLQKLSLQKHYHRSEHWVVVKGCAKTLIGGEEKLVYENESVFVPKGCQHRLENPGKVRLELIEVQVGEYVGEDDIVRFEDIYQRN